MKFDIADYLNRARFRGHLPSDRQLSKALGISAASLNAWRLYKAKPSDGQMVALAKLAGIDPRLALMDLNVWREKSSGARVQYLKLRALLEESVGRVGVIFALCLGALLTAPTGTKAEQTDVLSAGTVHYQTMVGDSTERNSSQLASPTTSLVTFPSSSIL